MAARTTGSRGSAFQKGVWHLRTAVMLLERGSQEDRLRASGEPLLGLALGLHRVELAFDKLAKARPGLGDICCR